MSDRPDGERPSVGTLEQREMVWHRLLRGQSRRGVLTPSRLTDLISAIGAILEFARANARKTLAPHALEALAGLDTRFGSLCGMLGPAPAGCPAADAQPDFYGNSFIPARKRRRKGDPADVRLLPTPAWQKAMQELRAYAELLKSEPEAPEYGPDCNLTRRGMETVLDQGGSVGYNGPGGRRLIERKDDLPSEDELSLIRTDPLGQQTPERYAAWCEDHARKLLTILRLYPQSARDGLSYACAFVRKAGELALAVDARAAVAAGDLIDACVKWDSPSLTEAVRKLQACAQWGRGAPGPRTADPPKGRKGRGGKRPLEATNPLRLQVYERIRREHDAGKKRSAILDDLKADKDFTEQVRSAGLKPNRALVKNALAFFTQPKRKNQETGPT